MSPLRADFPFEPREVEVHGSRMAYVETGAGPPVLFVHGNPTWSYLWRNVLPHVAPHSRCIAVDLIGMGRSAKPDLEYRFGDHARYLEGFIEALDLEGVVLVLHDWGSALGFDWARRHENEVRGIAFMEAILQPTRWSDFPSRYRLAFRLFRTPGVGWGLIVPGNVFLRQLLPGAIVRPLSAEETRSYRQPFASWRSRRPVRRWPCEIPIEGRPADVHAAVTAYHDWLGTTPLPKLLLHAEPGALIRRRAVERARERMPNLESAPVGRGLHFIQEDEPDAIGEALAAWLARLEPA